MAEEAQAFIVPTMQMTREDLQALHAHPVVLRSAIAIRLNDEPSATHVYLGRNADVKSGAPEPAATQERSSGSPQPTPCRVGAPCL